MATPAHARRAKPSAVATKFPRTSVARTGRASMYRAARTSASRETESRRDDLIRFPRHTPAHTGGDCIHKGKRGVLCERRGHSGSR